MYLLSKGYKIFKNGIVGIGGIGGLVGIGYGVATGGLSAIVWGSLLTTQSVIIGVDNYRSLQDLDIFLKKQANEWKQQREDMSKLFLQYQQEHNSYLLSMQESASQLEVLQKALEKESSAFVAENSKLRVMIQKNQEQIDHLEKIQKDYESQNLQLQSQNMALQTSTNELQKEVEKLHELHVQSKQLLKNLVLAGDIFNQFEQKFGTAANRLEETNASLDGKMNDLQATLLLLKEVAENLHSEHVRSLQMKDDFEME